MKDGIINIYKPAGMTSHDVIYKLRKILGIKKLGHTGTLDPLATGVLPVCIGKATRVCEYLDDDFKKYRCTMVLGIETDTQDVTGEIIRKADVSGIRPEDVYKAFEGFSGWIDQKPPMYSAVRVKGRRLYEYARAGEEVEVKTRKVFISSLEVEVMDFSHDAGSKKVTFTVECSKGTYIRTICQDVGEELGCGACMESLERLASGRFTVEDAVTLDELRGVAEAAGLSPDRKFGEEIPEVFEKYVKGIDYPLGRFGEAVMTAETGRRFIDGWHVAYRECISVTEPDWEEESGHKPDGEPGREPERRLYRMYAQDPASPGGKAFIGVAYHSDKYKKLVADKVFARSDDK